MQSALQHQQISFDAAVAVKLQFGLTEIDHCMMSLKRHCLDMKALSGGWVDCVELAQMGN